MTSTTMYAVTAEQVLAGHLLPGERILWTGKPDASKLFSPADKFLIPFSLLWAGFAVFWEVAVLASGEFFFALFGVPFVLLGLYLVAGRFLVKRRRRKRTTYAVTNKRFLNLLAGSDLTAVFLADVPRIDARIASDGSGDILFGSSPTGQLLQGTGFDFGRWGGWGGDAPFGFFDIPEASRVVDIASRARDEELQSRRG